MGFRPFLSINSQKNGEVRLCEVSVRGANFIGPPLPVQGEGQSLYGGSRAPRALVHLGEPWVALSGHFFRLDRNTNSWVDEYTLADFSGFVPQRNSLCGFHKVEISGIPHFITAYLTAGSSSLWRAAKYNTLSRQWTESMTLNAGLAYPVDNNAQCSSIMWKGKLYWKWLGNTGATRFHQYNPITNQAINLSVSATVNSGPVGQFCVYKNRLFTAHLNSTTAQLVEISDSATTARLNIATVATGGNNAKWAMWTDGDYLYIIIGRTAGIGVYRISIDGVGTYSATDVGSSVLPFGMNSKAGQSQCIASYVITDPHDVTSPPSIYIIINYRSDGDSVGYSVSSDILKWNGPSSPMTRVSPLAFTSSLSLPDTNGDGLRNFISGRPDIEVVSYEDSSSNDVKIYYRILESFLYPSGTPCSVRFLTNINEETLDTQAILRIGTSSPDGTISNNTITGLTTGSGVLRSVIWRAALQGATPSGFQRAAGILEID